MDSRYFLDEASLDEVILFLEGAEKRERNGWEQTRMLMVTVANSAGAKINDMQSWLPFPWDKVEKENEEDRLARLTELRKKAAKMENILKNKKK